MPHSQRVADLRKLFVYKNLGSQRVAKYPQALDTLLENLRKLPGIGEVSAERIAFFLLKSPGSYSQLLQSSIREVANTLTKCKSCFTVSEKELCPICSDKDRDHSRICVVETPRDLLAIEATGAWNGVYHVLLGRLSPTEGIREEDLTIGALAKRCRSESVEEVMLSTNPDLAGDATAMAVSRALGACKVRITRPARGVPVGHNLDALAGRVLKEAISSRATIPTESGA